MLQILGFIMIGIVLLGLLWVMIKLFGWKGLLYFLVILVVAGFIALATGLASGVIK